MSFLKSVILSVCLCVRRIYFQHFHAQCFGAIQQIEIIFNYAWIMSFQSD